MLQCMSSSLGFFLHSKSFEACDRTWIWFLTTQNTELYIAHTPSLFLQLEGVTSMRTNVVSVASRQSFFKIQRILKFLVSKYYSKFKLTNVFLLSTLENFRFLFKLQSCSKIFQLKNESDIRS